MNKRNFWIEKIFSVREKIKKGGTKISKSGFFYDKNNLKRDLIFLLLAIGILFLIFFDGRLLFFQLKQPDHIGEKTVKNPVEKIIFDPILDTSKWKAYQNQSYGFELKYPVDWNEPVFKRMLKDSKWEYQYQFRKKINDENNPYLGFDVKIYSTKKIKELASTDEYPIIRKEELKNSEKCKMLDGHLVENKKYAASLIYVDQGDECFLPAYFYSIMREDYIFNIVPATKDGFNVSVDPRISVIKNLPEFYSVVDSFNFIEIKKAPKVAAKPRITGPKPAVYETDSLGRRVCNKKNDHPSKSKENKKGHMDMECCLDSDEIPNPWCYYNPSKYGKYL